MSDLTDEPEPLDSPPAQKVRERTLTRDLEDNDAAPELKITPETPRQENLRQHRVSWRSFLVVQGLMLGLMALLAMQLQQAITSSAPAPLEPAPAAAPAQPAPELTELQSKLSRAQDQILTLQKQIDAQREERERTQAALQEMSDRMALVIKQASYVPGGAQPAAATVSDASQVAAMLPSVTPATSELILLKERNRLTDYADKAISTGAREALQAIVETMFDEQSKNLQHAAAAEFRRVQAYFEISSSIDPNYKLPLNELFKDAGIRAEADLKPDQLAALMQDQKQPWEVRLRCAYLLRASADPKTNEALLKTIHEDPSLDVVKQAQTSFERRVGQRFRLFDIPSIDAWWATQSKKG